MKYIGDAIKPNCPNDSAKPPSLVMTWLRLSINPSTVRRAFLTALVVGFVLITINYGSIILAGKVTTECVIRMCLTVMVPYIVSTVSSVATRRELAAKKGVDETAKN